MKYFRILILVIAVLVNGGTVSAQTAGTFEASAPMVRNITPTTAEIDIASTVLDTKDRASLYAEYIPTEQVCIMIYPTPANCLPQKTNLGVLPVTLTGLTPTTRYSVTLKKENTIRCVAAPCPTNERMSQAVIFTTAPAKVIFTRTMRLGSRGTDVSELQTILRTKGFLQSPSTGYYGRLTEAAVRAYQTTDMRIAATGTVGPLTRNALMQTGDMFEGIISAVSTACFADGECSVTIDGKKVVTTIGWSQQTVGSIRGTVTDIGSLESRIGSRARVFAQKTADGYTLYGNREYYIEVL